MRRVLSDLQAKSGITRSPSLHQAVALVCLAYNIGIGCHDGVKGDLADSTLLAKFNAGEVAAAAAQFLVWDKIHKNGVVVASAGLAVRRKAERAIFLTAD